MFKKNGGRKRTPNAQTEHARAHSLDSDQQEPRPIRQFWLKEPNREWRPSSSRNSRTTFRTPNAQTEHARAHSSGSNQQRTTNRQLGFTESNQKRRPPSSRNKPTTSPSDRRNNTRINKLNETKLQEFLSMEASKVTLFLASSQSAIKKLLSETMSYDSAELFLKVIRKIMESIALREKTSQILSFIIQSNFSSVFTEVLAGVDASGPNFVDFLENLMHILKIMLTQNPSEYLKMLQIIKMLEETLLLLDKSDDKVNHLVAMHNHLESIQRELSVQKRTRMKQLKVSADTPPNDFRESEIVPTIGSINSNEQVFLRKNKVNGAYDNVDHYLDVQFRLLKEDFYWPLRDGVKQYIKKKSEGISERIDNLYIFHNVKIVSSFCSMDGIAHRLSFDVSQMPGGWEYGKRLMYGSLVCLTADDFQTAYFATVQERNEKDLKKGLLDVLFFSYEDVNPVKSNTFIMAETTAYYQAYSHILKALKGINDENFPFQNYIIYSKSDVKAPCYLTQQPNRKIDLSCLTNDKPLPKNVGPFKTSNRFCLDILNDAWPSASDLRLNDSQYEALKEALTKEFSLIQGPPGTGKTYVGLKIVKALCSNRDVWQGDRKSPMLIVTYTNQALDKFLEGVVSFQREGILRVGSRSKSECLEPFALKNKRKEYRSRLLNDNRRHTKNEMNSLEDEISYKKDLIDHTSKKILDEDVLQNHMGRFYELLFQFFELQNEIQNLKDDSVLVAWLGYENFKFARKTEHFENKSQEELKESENEVYTEADFIQHNRMLEDDDHDDFSAKIKPNHEVIPQEIDQEDDEEMPNDDSFEITREEKKRRQKELQMELNSETIMNDEEVDQILTCEDIWSLDKKDRWRLYRRWVASYREELEGEILLKQKIYNTTAKVYRELLDYEDSEIMKDSLIVGMTTTAAAKYQALLLEIKPRIIVFEEAAEILEAHIVTALNPLCEHLILIGDHKQLRPNPNVYDLARNYNLNISLFERMVMNNCHVTCLASQHRMRPEISQLVKPIYSELSDDNSVMKYENIKGLASNVYFIQHNEYEQCSARSTSYSNPHEAHFLLSLCKYLLQQGYERSQITILTMYGAQLFQFKKLMTHDLKGVHVTVVDNFQGEENDIILLSLVRSNQRKNVGFLKTENRMCVALSRAKMGFYVIGNFEIISEQSELWRNILIKLKSQNLVGTDLMLYCQKHPDSKHQVRESADFSHVPEGGCKIPCPARLNCGHKCPLLCHPVDCHDQVKCSEQCAKTAPNCPERHKCQHVCSTACILCLVRVIKTVPDCGHKQEMACSTDPEYFKCRQKILKSYPCKHDLEILCFQRFNPCSTPCPNRLDCGHLCSDICGNCFERRIHSICSSGCQRLLICGHKCQQKQCNVCVPCTERCQNQCVHSVCQKLCGDLCEPCKMPCEWNCKHFKCNRLCHEPCDRPRCDKACNKTLECGHLCVGLCGEKCPSLCRTCDKQKLTQIIFGTEEEKNARFVQLEDCRHVFEVTGLDKWMSQENEDIIQLKVCPLCKVPIRRNLRYGNIINKILIDINAVKKKLIGSRKKIREVFSEIKKDRLETESYSQFKRLESFPTLVHCQSFSHRIKFISVLENLRQKILDQSLSEHCQVLSKWLLMFNGIFLPSHVQETEREIERITKIVEFHEAKTKFKRKLILNKSLLLTDELTKKSLSNEKSMIKKGLELLNSKQFSEIQDEISEIQEQLSMVSLKISAKEKTQVVKAIDLPPGHWFKCPKGHVYVIGECGGAMEHSKCPDCRSTIGGEKHTLAAGNDLAGEMDGARYAAWSDRANLANHQMDDE